MNHYERLGVPRHASQDDIKRAFREHAWKAHPDRAGDGDMAAINQAYATLMDPELREQYDATGDDRRMPPLDYQARDAVMSAIRMAVEMENDVELVRYMTDGFAARLIDIHRELAMIPDLVAKMKRRAKRVGSRNGQPNLVQMVVAQRIEQLDVHRQNLEKAVPVIRRAIEMIGDLVWLEEQQATAIIWE